MCTLLYQEPDKCFECDSQHPYEPYLHRNSHRIENVIYLMDSNRDQTWWQSVNGVYLLCNNPREHNQSNASVLIHVCKTCLFLSERYILILYIAEEFYKMIRLL